MLRRILAGAVAAIVAIVAAVFISASPANASLQKNPAYDLVCANSGLYVPAYGGLLQQCIRITGEYQGELGVFLPRLGVWNPNGGPVTVVGFGNESKMMLADDGFYGYADCVRDLYASPYGPVAWCTQERVTGNGWEARWGNWNVLAGRFFPSSLWFPQIRDYY